MDSWIDILFLQCVGRSSFSRFLKQEMFPFHPFFHYIITNLCPASYIAFSRLCLNGFVGMQLFATLLFGPGLAAEARAASVRSGS